MLASPRFGERWARHWLDVVRYADTGGFETDIYFPNAWRYRDYVVRAFNRDKPYDQFIKEQIAGDEIDANDPRTMERPDAPDPTAWGLHGSIHRACPHAVCVMHVHSIHATVLASLADSRLPPIDQNCATFYERYVIDDGYGGLLSWFWVASALTTIGLLITTRLALKERAYSAVMAATGLLLNVARQAR